MQTRIDGNYAQAISEAVTASNLKQSFAAAAADNEYSYSLRVEQQ